MEKPLNVTPEEREQNRLKYGSFQLPLTIEEEELSISLGKKGDYLFYHRDHAGETADKIILVSEGDILFNPVEPVNKPREITQFFLVEMEHSLTVKPRETSEIILTFPVEIAAFFLPDDHIPTILDVFSFVKPKYTLYGAPRNGLICRYWKSKVYATLPTPFPYPFLAGLMRLNIKNTTSRWIQLTRAVFNAYDMHIFYDHEIVFTDAYLKIVSESTAETGFENMPLHQDMEKSLELFASKRNIVTAPRLIMEEGL